MKHDRFFCVHFFPEQYSAVTVKFNFITFKGGGIEFESNLYFDNTYTPGGIGQINEMFVLVV